MPEHNFSPSAVAKNAIDWLTRPPGQHTLKGKVIAMMTSGGMGGGAVEIFNERNVEVVVGASGEAKDAVERYLKGELVSTGSVCHEHQHHDECGESSK